MTQPLKTLLFLARFAPLDPNAEPVEDEVWGNSPFYHHRLHQALYGLVPKVICAREPSELMRLHHEVDYVYSIYNRASFRNSEVLVSSLCAYLRLPCLGGHPNVRVIAEDKHLFKLVARRLGLATPDWVKIDSWDDVERIEHLELPCIVKLRFGADSAGISSASVAYDFATLRRLVQEAQAENLPVIVEKFIDGHDITIAAIGGTPCEIFEPVRITSDTEGSVQTYRQKKFGEGKRDRQILRDDDVRARAQATVAKLYSEIHPIDYFRTDFRHERSTGDLYLLEMNAVCNLRPNSSFAVSCAQGYPDYDALVRRILSGSLTRQALTLE